MGSRGYRLPSGANKGFRMPKGAGLVVPDIGELLCEATNTSEPVKQSTVSPAISLAVSPASHREQPTIEMQGSQSSNQSGTEKPNCYSCKHRAALVGDAHSSCQHQAANPIAAMVFMAGQTEFKIKQIHIRGNPHGVRSGWFIWPMNFDPLWLEICTGYENANNQNS